MLRHRLPFVFLLLFVTAACAGAFGGPSPAAPPEPPTDRLLPVDAAADRWVDSVLASLDTRGLAGQLIFPWMWGRYEPAAGDAGRLHRAWVTEVGVGGLLTSVGPPVAMADKLNRLQRLADVPLLVAADLEHGPGQRIQGGTLLPYGVDLGGGTTFPPAMALGAAGDPSLAYAMGRVTAAEARAVGIHMSFAPVVDVNNNPDNPIINTRSYSGDPAVVAELAVAQLAGMQEHGLLATAKHFPGHGDAEADTHVAPYILRIDARRADSVELLPYRSAIRAGVAGVMSAHIAFPALAGDSTLPATLSRRMLDSLLVGELGFQGLVVTDALNMGAIVQRFGPGQAAVRALEAGADILLQPTDPLAVLDAVEAAVESGRLTRGRLERSARKVLEAKTRVGLHRRRTVAIDRIADVVGAPEHQAVAAAAAARSITLVRDRQGLIPLVPLRDRRVLLVTYTDQVAPFAGRTLARELTAELAAVRRVTIGPGPPPRSVLDSVMASADSADLVIVVADAGVRAGGGAGAIDSATATTVRRLARARPLVLVSLGNPYLVAGLPEVGSYILGWSGAEVSQTAVADALLGRGPVTGQTPIAIPPLHARGEGLRRWAVTPARRAAVRPADQPADDGGAYGGGTPPLLESALDSLAAVVQRAIDDGVTPGAVVAVGSSRGGVWVRPFGRIDWSEDAPPVTDTTLYDLASLTKVVATTSAVMRLLDAGRLALDAPLSRYLAAWPTGGWRDSVTIRRLLTHRAGLPPFARFWHPSRGALRGDSAVIAGIAGMEAAYPPGTESRYSDLGFILLGAAVEAVADTSLAGFLDRELWSPMGMRHTRFNPTGRVADPVPLEGIAPTERDTVLRHMHVHGEVHDENAWAMGGIAGHAGLFSTAPDLARFAHTLLRGGRVGEARVFRPETVVGFTTRHAPAGRALGWEMEDPETGGVPTGPRPAYPAVGFGHTGFTGTGLWIDPARDLYVVLLTNRINPTRQGAGIGALRSAVRDWAERAVVPEP